MREALRPPPRIVGSEEPAASRQLTQQEELAKYSAQKLASMANEIKDIIEAGGIKSDSKDNFFVEISESSYDTGRISVNSYLTEDIKKPDGKNAYISFTYSPNAKTDYGKKLGTRGNFELVVGVHSDEQSQEAYNEYAKREPILAGNAYTRYYFDEDGNFAKALGLPVNMPDSRPLLHRGLIPGVMIKSVEGEMTPSDFELAGKALSVILGKIRPQTPQVQQS